MLVSCRVSFRAPLGKNEAAMFETTESKSEVRNSTKPHMAATTVVSSAANVGTKNRLALGLEFMFVLLS